MAKVIKVNLGGDTEDVKLTGPDFDLSTPFEKGISRYKEDYDFMFKGSGKECYSKGYSDESDIDEKKHTFNEGDKIALIENTDWEEFESEFAGEIEFISKTNVYYDHYGSVYIFMGGKSGIISFIGEYVPLDEKTTKLLNSEFGTDYKVIFSC